MSKKKSLKPSPNGQPFRLRTKSFRANARHLWKSVLELKDEQSTTAVARSFAGMGITVRADNVLEFADIAIPKSRDTKSRLVRKLNSVRDNFNHHRKLVLKDREPKVKTAGRTRVPAPPAEPAPVYTPPATNVESAGAQLQA